MGVTPEKDMAEDNWSSMLSTMVASGHIVNGEC